MIELLSDRWDLELNALKSKKMDFKFVYFLFQTVNLETEPLLQYSYLEVVLLSQKYVQTLNSTFFK